MNYNGLLFYFKKYLYIGLLRYKKIALKQLDVCVKNIIIGILFQYNIILLFLNLLRTYKEKI